MAELDERTAYLYARHNGMDDAVAARFVTWWVAQGSGDLAADVTRFRQECVT